MGYRSYNRRYRSPRRRRRSRQDNNDVPLGEALGDALAGALIALVRGFGRFVLWMFRWNGSTRASPPRPTRPNPYARDAGFSAAPQVAQASTRPPLNPPPLPNPPSRGVPQSLPYRRARHILSKGERAFWHPLFRAVTGKYRIFCKVRLQDVVSAPDQSRDERRWFCKIRGYHVDFVICEPKTTAPLLAVELDGRSHRSPRQQERDEFKKQVLAAAGVPLYRVPAQEAYDPVEIGQTIQRMIDEARR